MTVAVCIASRGRPELLGKTVRQLRELSERSDTIISIALDDDDETVTSLDPFLGSTAKVSIAAREDSLGEKYNRAWRNVNASVYVLWADDVITTTKGWDSKIQQAAQRFTDGYGFIYFGKIEGVMQPGIAVTRGMIDVMGFFCVPYFPYWWHDTWIDEIGRMADRITQADIDMRLLQPLAGKSRGVREIEFWAKIFDDTRFVRRRAAERIITIGDDQPFRKLQLRSRLTAIEQWVNQRNSILRNPADAQRLEKFYGFDNAPDERYTRMKSAAPDIMTKLRAEAF